MKAHVVLAHPERRSFNGLLADTTQNTLTAAGWGVTLSDLYGLEFDPREGAQHYTSRADADRFHAQTEQRFNADQGTTPPEVMQELDNVREADLLVVHFPLWWFGMPAILKGWIDRVFVYGAMYRSTMRYDAGVCAGKKMIACVTTGASKESCSFNGREGDTQMHLWPILFPFRYVGFDVLVPAIFHGIGGVSFVEGDEDGTSGVELYKQHWADQLNNLSGRPTVPYNRDSEFDDTKRLVEGASEYSPFVSHTPNNLWAKPMR
ncbi:MAG: NAD(P)H-dependent oxidoreductase [Pseudomonadota bacterium]